MSMNRSKCSRTTLNGLIACAAAVLAASCSDDAAHVDDGSRAPTGSEQRAFELVASSASLALPRGGQAVLVLSTTATTDAVLFPPRHRRAAGRRGRRRAGREVERRARHDPRVRECSAGPFVARLHGARRGGDGLDERRALGDRGRDGVRAVGRAERGLRAAGQQRRRRRRGRARARLRRADRDRARRSEEAARRAGVHHLRRRLLRIAPDHAAPGGDDRQARARRPRAVREHGAHGGPRRRGDPALRLARSVVRSRRGEALRRLPLRPRRQQRVLPRGRIDRLQRQLHPEHRGPLLRFAVHT